MRELALSSLEKGTLKENLINIYKYLKGGCQESVSRLFVVVPMNWKRSNRQKVMRRKFHINMWKKTFIVWVIEHRNSLPCSNRV